MLIKSKNNIAEGEIFNKWLENRFNKNKNVLSAITGATGSGKSYQDLRRAELWYRYKFNEQFPSKNICFSVGEAMKRLTQEDLRKGEIIILEEAGVNIGSLDFQNKISKLFGYVLQSFRSMNVGIFFNLPYLSMLNKSARMLIHIHFVTSGIDHNKKLAKSKGYFIQINQDTGKVYRKYLRVKHNERVQVIKRFNYKIPSDYLINSYEHKKNKFVIDLTKDFSDKLDKIDKDNMRRLARKDLTDKQQFIYDKLIEGLKQGEIAKLLQVNQSLVSRTIKAIKKKGYDTEIKPISIGNSKNDIKNPLLVPI